MSALPIYEVLGDFYLGRQYDPKQKKSGGDPILFPSKNLVTHGLVVGMTGSGKTGLCLDIIEEAAIDNIPVIAIDPKGDLGNLLLTFPGLKPDEFKPWVNEEEAKKAGLSIDDYAAKQAEFWKNGLAKWDQDAERIVRLRNAADFAIYTPGSTAGWPVSVMRSFEKPPAEVLEDGELFRERVLSTAAGLLQLVGIEADAVQSRETVLLTNLIQNAWSQGKDFDLAGLIQEVQQPSITKIGVLDVDSFYPAKQRFELAMKLNNLLASPSFAGWMQGEPLDIQRMFYTPEGKPRVCVFSVAHLGDAERMFFVTMLLNQVLAWMRAQKGTSSLRAMLYMDEIFGYFPPIANPPSKMPLLTLLKQARAFGLGVVLATQNPVDLDYKGLANIGTWFIGRLQTDRDKARILDGLEGAASDQGGKFDRAALEKTLAGLGSRIFLLHSVHANEQKLFESRWAMSYLSGPLSRTQIKQLMADKKSPTPPAETKTPAVSGPSSKARPILPPEVKQLFVPSRRRLGAGERLVYQPRLLGAGSIRYTLARAKLDYPQDVTVTVEVRDGAVPVDWSESEEVDIAIDDLLSEPESGEFQEISAAVSQPKNMAKWATDFSNWLYTKRFQLKYCEHFDLYSAPNETDADFDLRVQQKFREERDGETDKLRRRYETKIAAAEEKVRKEKARVEKKSEQAKQGKLAAFLSFVASIIPAILKMFMGSRRSKMFTATDISKTATSAKSAGRAMQQSSDVGRAEEDLAAAEAKLEELKKECDDECRVKIEELEQAIKKLDVVEGKSTRANINVKLVALAWLPYYANDTQTIGKAY